jgi:alkylation response protein AidB-like acyl-CoA dehydrogenase
MWGYSPPLEDMQFVIDELLEVRQDWRLIPRFAELDADTVPQILEAAGHFVVQSLAPINASGDLQGCRYEDGAVVTPEGFPAAYRRFVEAGWPALPCDPDLGGQGLPQILNAALYEMLYSTNHGWAMYSGLAHGAYECLRAHAPDWIKSVYLPKIVSGEWLTTMCLTEPQAGSDVGLVRTRAEPRADGSYALTGAKIFISGGEHDLTDNIVHLVLARLPDAPAGTRGISLFLVPKLAGSAGAARRNSIGCTGIEKKMGIKGSSTCVMNFAAAEGWMIGEPNRGLAAMFVMMNSARLYVGLQGLGHAEMACQNALRYAGERLQMRAVTRPSPAGGATHGGPPAGGADPIILQPAMRKTLMTLRVFVEGERALGLWAAHLLDLAEFHPDSVQRSRAQDLVSLLTPVIKSFFTENGFTLSSAALQVWGGYGYIHDYGIEQTVRDSRIAMIYEGTNEVQAIDLLVRKVIGDGGRKFALLLEALAAEADRCAAVPACEPFAGSLGAAHAALARVTKELVSEAEAHPEHAYRVAGDYLRLVGLTLLACLWARAARLALPRAAQGFYAAKRDSARFYFDHVMPEAQLRLHLIDQRRSPLPWISAAS